MKTILIYIASILLLTTKCFSQSTSATNIGTLSKFIGYTNNFPLDIYTNSRYRAYFSTSQSIANGINGPGDGLVIRNEEPTIQPGAGIISIFTTPGFTNGTEIIMGLSGNIAGRNSRFEMWGRYNGLYFNTPTTTGSYKFAQQGTVYGLLGTNHYWVLGQQTDFATPGISGSRRLHVFDNTWQFRLSYGGPNSPNTTNYTDFLANSVGNLQILPNGGRVGINATLNPTATLDVFGDMRIRNVPAQTPNSLLVGVNADSPSDVNVRRIDFTGSSNDVLLGNGTFGPLPGIGAPCGTGAASGALSFHSRVNMNNNNFYFTNMAGTSNTAFNKVGIGYNCSNLTAKFNVYQKENFPLSFGTTTTYIENQDVAVIQGLTYTGIHSIAHGIQSVNRTENVGGLFIGMDAQTNTGIRGLARPGAFSGSSPTLSIAGNFAAYGGNTTVGVRTTADGAVGNYGTWSTSSGGLYSYAIFASASGGLFTRAGYFNGNVEVINGTYLSDQQFKDSVTSISSALKTVNLLKPVAYKFDVAGYPQFNFGTEQQYGFIAQDVETVLPSLVYESKMPAQYDTLGNEISPAVDYKSLNYIALIPVNTQAIIELNQKVDQATLSDESIKTNVQNLSGSLDKVLEMRGVSYDWDHSVHPELNLDSANHVGFIAQEIAQIDPRLTYVADDELLHIEYDKVVPILAEAIQELNSEVESKDSIIGVLTNENTTQQETIDDLNARLTNLENCLSALLPMLCSMNQSLIQNNSNEQQEEVRKNLAVTLSDRTAIVLDQNVPNPFAEQTVVNFSIPLTVLKAQIHFYDGNGKLIQSVDITERGLGSLTVFGSDLSSGIYTYTLVADGKIVATKKMMKQ